MAVSPTQVKELREKTGCGMMDCKNALEESGGDIDNAVKSLRKKGLADLAKRSGKAANEGLVESYIHALGRIGVLVEVNCETDFVSRNTDFQEFAHDIAMQIAASMPVYVSREDLPDDLIKAEQEIYRDQALAEGKPEKIIDKIIEGKMEKYYGTVCLMDQPFVKDQDIMVKDYLGELVGKLGENIGIRRFARYQLGEEL